MAARQGIDAAGGPRPGKHNWFRGATLRTYDAQAQRALAALDGHLDTGLAREVWKTALDTPWTGADIRFHGDAAPGNLLLDDGELAAVIDFGTCGVGDPSCDMAIAWTLLTADGRQAFRERLAVDEATWARGRGWALWKHSSPALGLWAGPTRRPRIHAACSRRSSPNTRPTATEVERLPPAPYQGTFPASSNSPPVGPSSGRVASWMAILAPSAGVLVPWKPLSSVAT
ncbi:Phosphotransferase enzyme family protein [Amycolatopsis sp. YIM 10]|nr:Phosphotransferase enzyme family protein [Amycolatopsis sp. YIM 10]